MECTYAGSRRDRFPGDFKYDTMHHLSANLLLGEPGLFTWSVKGDCGARRVESIFVYGINE